MCQTGKCQSCWANDPQMEAWLLNPTELEGEQLPLWTDEEWEDLMTKFREMDCE